ncbi:unnamed protein product [Euphydryas editha]|uniref:Uncharacterized protein n=1 Tax=Euphydryas editha TaxID=104508 RepID=A0AAU9V499_EUPED|nr:unnamed protein product [Euphydryas editha]
MIHRPGKPAHETSPYRLISLIPVLSKLWEKLFLVHRVYDTIRHCLETKQYCFAAFLYVQAGFRRVWHKGLLCKIKKPGLTWKIEFPLLSRVKQDLAYSMSYWSTLILPQTEDITIASYANNAAFVSSVDPLRATANL